MQKPQQWSPKIVARHITPLRAAYDAFLIAQRASRHSPRTLDFYEKRLPKFLDDLERRGITEPAEVTPTTIRAFIADLQGRPLSEHYVHGIAQTIKTFCRFMQAEGLCERNAFERVLMPKLDKRILPAFTPEDVKKLIGATETARDKAVVLCLLDSGARAQEFLDLSIGDIDMKTGAVHIRRGKGAKGRVTYLGGKALRVLGRFLRERPGARATDPLWPAHQTDQVLSYFGLAQMLHKLGERAGVEHCTAHTFRRTCALWSLRAGMSIYHLRAMLGHSDLSVLQRYLALVESDVSEAHREHGPVDTML